MSESRILYGRYELGALIGAGGSSRVYVGTDRVLDREVAVKVLDRQVAESADPAAHERFLREARSAARFTHPNAVATYDAGEDDDTLFIVMEHVAGVSLARVIADEAPLDDDRVTAIADQLLSALGAAHAAGIVHRDVKPANLLVTPSGTVKLADFGIAKRFDEITSSLTSEGMVVGTREYLAPEQARGHEATPATDLFAAGAVLFELSTGQRLPPIPPDSDVGADPRAVRPGVGPDLATAIAVATAGRPAARFADAASMRAAIVTGLPVTQLAVGHGRAPTASTAVMGATPSPATKVLPASPPAPRPDRAARRRWSLAIAAAFALMAIGVAAWAFADGARDIATADPTPAETQGTAVPPSTVAATTAPTTAAATTAPTTTPTTAPPATTAPPDTTAPETTEVRDEENPDELVPGFPDTDDLDQFIEQLRDGRDVAGKQARKLGDKMDDLQNEDEDELRDEIEKLREEIDEWIDREELDPIIGERALEFLDEFERDAARDRDDD